MKQPPYQLLVYLPNYCICKFPKPNKDHKLQVIRLQTKYWKEFWLHQA